MTSSKSELRRIKKNGHARKKSKYAKVSWSDVNLHQVMIKDQQRTNAFKKAIEKNVKANDTVIDMGCGMGILSLFAAKTNCQKVYAIDNSEVIQIAKRIARANSLDERIQFVKKDIFKFRPHQKADVLIHEHIGGFLWDEGFVKKVVYARKHHLKAGAKIIPYKVELFLAPSSAPSGFDKSVNFWSHKRYGIDFGSVSHELWSHSMSQAFYPSTIQLKTTNSFLSAPQKAHTVNLIRDTQIPKKISTSFRFNRSGVVRAVCGFLIIYLDEKIVLSTAPSRQLTHWGQMYLPYPGEKEIKKGDTLTFELKPHEDPHQWKFKFAFN